MSEKTRVIFSGMQILHEAQWLKKHAVVVEDGIIHAVIPEDMIQHHLPAHQHTFSADSYLIPGMIDLHVHGAKNCDVMDCDIKALGTITRALAAEGVTGFLATTMTAPKADIENVLRVVASFEDPKQGAAILGVHLEGPFIASAKMGAQNPAGIMAPDADLMRHWQKIAGGSIRLVTIAPELSGVTALIKALRDMGIVASVGHTNATYDETCSAITAGCTHATHLFNAMRGIHQREPGAVTALLLSENVSAELIVDGVHLHPAIVDLSLRMKGRDRLLLVTDAMRAKCLGDGRYDLGGQMVDVKSGKATLSDGTLAGSTLRMPQALKNIVKYTGCSLQDAVVMASRNPARVLGLPRKGEICIGNDADLVVLNHELNVQLTMREGYVVYQA